MGSAPSNVAAIDPYVPIRSPRLNAHYSDMSEQHTIHQPYNRSKTKIIDCGFSGVWSRYVPCCICPDPRSGHFSCYSDDMSTLFIGYGISYKQTLLNDCWALDCVNKIWRKIELHGDLVSPRTGSRAFYYDGKIIIFGGFAESTYYADLHYIDVNTGIVNAIQTTGLEPCSRTSPIFFLYNEKAYVWGGYNEQWPNELSVLDLHTLHWEQYPQSIPGRTGVSFGLWNDKVYTFGCCKNSNLLIIDPVEYTMTEVPTYGSQPSFSTIGSGMLVVDHFALFFGGKANSQYALLYACDLEINTWFVFYILPDGDTVTMADGMISEIGMFLIPRVSHFSFVYEKSTQDIIITLGEPMDSPPPLSVIHISHALAHLRHRDDMTSILVSNCTGSSDLI